MEKIASDLYPEAFKGAGGGTQLVAAGREQQRRHLVIIGMAIVGLAAAITLGIGLGPVKLGPVLVWTSLLGLTTGLSHTIVWNIRLPRVLLGHVCVTPSSLAKKEWGGRQRTLMATEKFPVRITRGGLTAAKGPPRHHLG